MCRFRRKYVDRLFVGFSGIFVLFQVSLGLKDTNMSIIKNRGEKEISSFLNPKNYFILKVAPLFANWSLSNSNCTAEKINGIFQKLDIKARLIENTIKFCNESFEFMVYMPAYKKEFLFRYTPLINNLSKLIQNEDFLLEVKLFSRWKPITLDLLFGQ